MSGRLATILLIIVTVFMFAAALPPHVNATQPGPTIQLANGHQIRFQYSDDPAKTLLITDQDIQTANSILNQYVPQVVNLFWMPNRDITVTIYKALPSTCTSDAACAGPNEMWIRQEYTNYWNNIATWTHEFTHVLQANGPDAGFSCPSPSDISLLYVEPTALAVQQILAPETQLTNDQTIDRSFWGADSTGLEAVQNYYGQNNYGDSHADVHAWISLYYADHMALRKVNAGLTQLAEQQLRICDVPSLREFITETTGLQVLDGLPIGQWLAVEGILGHDELPKYPITDWLSSQWIGPPSDFPQVSLNVWTHTANSSIRVDASQSKATIYDAITRSKLVDAAPFSLPTNSNDTSHLSSLNDMSHVPYAPVLRIQYHIVGDNLIEDTVFLLYNYGLQTNTIIFITSDGWVQDVNSTATVNGQSVPIVNGILNLDSLTTLGNITLPSTVTHFPFIQNYLPVPKVFFYPIEPNVLRTFHDTGQTVAYDSSNQPHQITASNGEILYYGETAQTTTTTSTMNLNGEGTVPFFIGTLIGPSGTYPYPQPKSVLVQIYQNNTFVTEIDLNGTATESLSLPAGTYTGKFSSPGYENDTFTFQIHPGDNPLFPIALTPLQAQQNTQQATPRCVIATAAYGSELAAPVQFLRTFRDTKVNDTLLGAAFLGAFNNWYYSWAPPVAQTIATSDSFMAMTRAIILPIIGTLYLANMFFTTLEPINVELATLISGLTAAALIGAIYLTPIIYLTTRIVKRRITRRTLIYVAIIGSFLTLLGTIPHGTTGIPQNLTALTVLETAILSPFILTKEARGTLTDVGSKDNST
jgi:hypothetical protein